MGWQLAAQAFRADLSPNLRTLLVIMCDVCAMDDPENSFASLSYLAYESGYGVRQVRKMLRVLEAAEYVTCLTPGVGRGHTSRYHIHLDRIPKRPPWREMRERLVELGELTENAGLRDVHAAVRRRRRDQTRQEAAQ